MRTLTRLCIVFWVISFLVLTLNTTSMALDYPTKLIQLIVPTTAGSTNDIIARILAPKLGSILKQPIIVVSKPGGGQSIGIKFALNAKPDGYTMLTASGAPAASPALNPGIGFKLEDFASICSPVLSPFFLVVKADAPWKTLADLVSDAKKNPGKYTYGHVGFGTGDHCSSELFTKEAGAYIVGVPRGGEPESLAGVLGGHVNMAFISKTLATPLLKTGELRALAVRYPERLKEFPSVPSLAELGYPKSAKLPGWHGYFFSAKTPREIVEKMAKAFDVALRDKEVIENIEKTGMIMKVLMLDDAMTLYREQEQLFTEAARLLKIQEGTGK